MTKPETEKGKKCLISTKYNFCISHKNMLKATCTNVQESKNA